MTNVYYNYLVSLLFKFNLFIIIIILLISLIIYFLSKFFNFNIIYKNLSSSNFLKNLLIFSILLSFFVNVICFIFFIKSYQDSMFFMLISNFNKFNSIYNFNIFLFSFLCYKTSIEFFGFVFLIIAYIVGFISFLSLDTRLYNKNIKYIITCNLIIIIIHFFVICNDILLLFLFYEFMLIPSFLFVYFVSPYKRGIQSSIYFLIWTQIGSLLVLISVVYLYTLVGNTSFDSLKNYTFTNEETWFVYMLLFFGFGFKIPIWPFQFWLTKTHVEAPAGFSIFLSGFLVKTAVYGFYKITNECGISIDTSFFSIFCIMGILDASLKMWGQLDLKKLVAYGTVQEMNLIYLSFLWGDSGSFIGGVLFCITHAFLSSLMFFLVDCIQKRYKTRIISEISGILHTTPNLGISIILMQVLYSGLPGTLKFLSEFYIFSGLINSTPISLLIIIYICNFIGLVGFSKCWFNVLFGLNSKNKNINDLTYKEILIISICVFSMFFFGIGFNCII